MQASAEHLSSSSTIMIPAQWLVSPDFKVRLTPDQVDTIVNHDPRGWMTGAQLIIRTTTGSIFTIKLGDGEMQSGTYRGQPTALRKVDYDYKGDRSSQNGSGFLFYSGGTTPKLRIQYQLHDGEGEDMTSHGGLQSSVLDPKMILLVEWNNL
ncbi:MAG TPA: hypothetical protein VIM37_03080 [Candidatus Microsaccharimonas sp.]|jgi:hypothetical protein